MQAHSLEVGEDEGDRRAMEVRCIRVALPQLELQSHALKAYIIGCSKNQRWCADRTLHKEGKGEGSKAQPPTTPNTQRNPCAGVL